jgi:hypothetical protein
MRNTFYITNTLCLLQFRNFSFFLRKSLTSTFKKFLEAFSEAKILDYCCSKDFIADIVDADIDLASL